jgi:hypothetical protein
MQEYGLANMNQVPMMNGMGSLGSMRMMTGFGNPNYFMFAGSSLSLQSRLETLSH